MMKIYAYLRVSTRDQDPAAQRHGLLEYANARGLAPIEFVAETASRKTDWRKRALGELLERASAGDVILTPEFSRIGGSALAVLDFLHAAAEKGVAVHVTKQQFVADDSLQSKLMATVFGMAADVERHFIRERSLEGVAVARSKGKTIGRPKGSTSATLKLDDKSDEIQGMLALGLSRAKIAKRVRCSRDTLANFIERRGLKPGEYTPGSAAALVRPNETKEAA